MPAKPVFSRFSTIRPECVTSILPSRHSSTRPFGCQRPSAFAGINPHNSVRTYPPDFLVRLDPCSLSGTGQPPSCFLNNSEWGGGAIVSTLSNWRVHGDSHRLNPVSSIISIRIPAQPIARFIKMLSLIQMRKAASGTQTPKIP